MRALWIFLKRFWLPITIGIVIILGFAIWVQLTKETNSFAGWVFDFLTQWAIVLSATVTLLLAVAAFWVISDTRHFRYLDDKTKTISNLNEWAAETLRQMMIPARFSKDQAELKSRLFDCRTELMIKVAESVKVFAEVRRLLANIHIDRANATALETAITNTDSELRSFIDTLFNIDITLATPPQIDAFIEQVSHLASQIKKLIEASSILTL